MSNPVTEIRSRTQGKGVDVALEVIDRKSTRLNSSHANISYAVFCLKKKSFERRAVGVRSYANRLAGHPRGAPERQVERRAVPVLELEPPPGRDRNRIDRPAGCAREF